ncbi:MAG: prolipoprotein diacylglyceryl transferase [Bacteroidota bacterium]
MEPIHWNADPVIVMLFDHFPLKYYGILFMTGVALGYLFVRKAFLKAGKSLEELDALGMYIFVGIVLGARLGHCLFYEPDYFLSRPLEMLLPIQKIDGSYHFTGYLGLASHGGTLGVFLAILLYYKKYKINIWWLLDQIALVGPLTGAFIRIGNFMNSEILGKPTNGNFGVIFERVDQIPRHPAQLYEAAVYLLIFVFLQWLNRNHPKPNGFLFGLVLSLVFSARFFIEFFKINQVNFEEGMFLNMGQLLSIPIVLVGVITVFFKRRNRLAVIK